MREICDEKKEPLDTPTSWHDSRAIANLRNVSLDEEQVLGFSRNLDQIIIVDCEKSTNEGKKA